MSQVTKMSGSMGPSDILVYSMMGFKARLDFKCTGTNSSSRQKIILLLGARDIVVMGPATVNESEYQSEGWAGSSCSI